MTVTDPVIPGWSCASTVGNLLRRRHACLTLRPVNATR